MAKNNDLRIAVIGAGPSGIGAGHELLAQGFTQFTIFEKSDAAGGTWHQHSYPGLDCDVWAHSYSFSYAPNPDWSASFVSQPEIETYLQRCAREFGLEPHLKLNTKIIRATFQDNHCWVLDTENGESFEFDIIINAMGNQHTPLLPDVAGMDSFNGQSWHATEWNHDVDLKGKRVAIVGSAAAAVQIVPKVAQQASQLTVLQRTPNWIMPRGRKVYSESRRKWFRRLPLLIKLTRWTQGFMMGFVHQAATLGHKRMEQFENTAKKFINETISDPKLRAAVTPTSHYACKRGLVSDDFYPALTRDNVELIAEGLQQVRPEGITTSSGKDIDVDIIIYCTGYRILDYDRIEVRGLHGKSLANTMEAAPEAYKGICAPDFPNYFFAVGPNGMALNVSYFISLEQNVKTIVSILKEKQAAGAGALNVKKDLTENYNQWMGTQFEKFSWGASSCNSYYRTESGQVPFLFPGSFKELVVLHDECGLHEYEQLET